MCRMFTLRGQEPDNDRNEYFERRGNRIERCKISRLHPELFSKHRFLTMVFFSSQQNIQCPVRSMVGTFWGVSPWCNIYPCLEVNGCKGKSLLAIREERQKVKQNRQDKPLCGTCLYTLRQAIPKKGDWSELSSKGLQPIYCVWSRLKKSLCFLP